MNVLTKAKLRHKLFFIKHKIDFHTFSLVHFEIKQNSVSPLSRKKGFESKQRHETSLVDGGFCEAAGLRLFQCSIAESGLGYTESQLSMSHRPIAFRLVSRTFICFLWPTLFPQINEGLKAVKLSKLGLEDEWDDFRNVWLEFKFDLSGFPWLFRK